MNVIDIIDLTYIRPPRLPPPPERPPPLDLIPPPLLPKDDDLEPPERLLNDLPPERLVVVGLDLELVFGL